MLTFVVIGGGPTGVELAGTIAELSRSTLTRDFRHIDPASARIILFEAGPRLLSTFPERLSNYARTTLQKLGVEVRTETPVDEIDGEGLSAGTERIRTTNILWCAGTAARPAAKWLGAASARNGAVKVLDDCSVMRHPNIFAIGDVSSFTGDDGRPLAGLAPVATQQCAYVGRLDRPAMGQAGRPGRAVCVPGHRRRPGQADLRTARRAAGQRGGAAGRAVAARPDLRSAPTPARPQRGVGTSNRRRDAARSCRSAGS